MMNYIRSEWYRITHTKTIYGMTGILSALMVCMNIALYISNNRIDDFPYALVSFSFNFLLSNMFILLVAGGMVATLLFSGESQYGTLKNTIAYGIDRERIFLGKCVVSLIAAVCSMVVILFFYIGSACLLLGGPVAEPMREMFTGILALLPCAVASVVLTVAFLQYFDKEIKAVICWSVIMYLIPQICYLAGFKIEVLKRAAGWMPRNYLLFEVSANMSGYNCLWDTSAGLLKCILSGLIGIIVFAAAGFFLGRKKEV